MEEGGIPPGHWVPDDPVFDTRLPGMLVGTLKVFAQACRSAAKDSAWYPATAEQVMSALRHAMVMALDGSAGMGVLRRKPKDTWPSPEFDWRPEFFTDRLEDDEELFKRIHQGRWMQGLAGAQPAPRDGPTAWAFKNTRYIRNWVVHFSPATRAVKLGGAPDNYRRLLSRIRFLVFESNMIHPHEFEGHGNVNAALDDAEAAVNEFEAGLAVSPGPYHPVREDISPAAHEAFRRLLEAEDE